MEEDDQLVVSPAELKGTKEILDDKLIVITNKQINKALVPGTGGDPSSSHAKDSIASLFVPLLL